MLSPATTLSQHLATDIEAVNAHIRTHMHSEIPLIPKLADYLISSGGKRIRPLMTLACTALYEGDMSRAHALSAAVEFIHSATLLHDDVVDESDTRRGQTAANLIFGNQATVLVGDFLFSRAFQLMTSDPSIDILRILSQASATIAEGEILQLTHKSNASITMDTYLTIVAAKTAALFSASCEIAPLIAGAPPEAAHSMKTYGRALGIAFQIADDTLDYAADAETLGKAPGDDFREGKFTAPVLLALQNATAQEQAFWTRTLAQGQQTQNDFTTALDLLKQHNALDNSLALAHTYGDQAKAAMHAAPNTHPVLKQTLIDLVDYSITRTS